MNRTLVLGLGNTLLGDEGVGVYAARQLARMLPATGDLLCIDGGTLSFPLAGPIEDSSRLIVIDAAELRAPPGSVRLFEGHDMDRHVAAGGKRSVHEVSLADLLAIACLCGRLPQRRALIGIQPKAVDWSDSPSAAGQRGVDVACRLAADLLHRWDQADAA